jgi:CDP-glucose 4,6-dehydratase
MGFWTDRPVFVTGATGMLGSHLTAELVERGADVVCLVRDRVARSHFQRLGLDRRVVTVSGALEDHDLLTRAINEYEIETVFHLGAQTIVGTASRGPLSTWEANVRGTYNLLEACRLNAGRVKRVVVASSDKAYGDQPVLPYTEDAPLVGRFPYDCSKSCADLITRSYHESFGLPTCVTRCGNLFGPGDLNWNRIIPGTIRSALRGERPLIRSDGTFVRDYFYVGDAAHAYLTLAEQMARPEVNGEAFNFSLEKPLTVLEIARLVLHALGRADLEPEVQGQASNEIRAQFLSSEKARRLLGWAPRYGLDEGLALTIAWYRELLGVPAPASAPVAPAAPTVR